jgi:hypothetical protein
MEIIDYEKRNDNKEPHSADNKKIRTDKEIGRMLG